MMKLMVMLMMMNAPSTVSTGPPCNLEIGPTSSWGGALQSPIGMGFRLSHAHVVEDGSRRSLVEFAPSSRVRRRTTILPGMTVAGPGERASMRAAADDWAGAMDV
jgi:hypothetical protein